MAKFETESRRIAGRLQREGWQRQHGGSHDLFTNTAFPGVVIALPRHRQVSIGVARQIAKLAKWI